MTCQPREAYSDAQPARSEPWQNESAITARNCAAMPMIEQQRGILSLKLSRMVALHRIDVHEFRPRLKESYTPGHEWHRVSLDWFLTAKEAISARLKAFAFSLRLGFHEAVDDNARHHESARRQQDNHCSNCKQWWPNRISTSEERKPRINPVSKVKVLDLSLIAISRRGPPFHPHLASEALIHLPVPLRRCASRIALRSRRSPGDSVAGCYETLNVAASFMRLHQPACVYKGSEMASAYQSGKQLTS
jgi:hypothetical protein